jgi:tetratricopeptide (TPR) repeat protein
MRLARSSIIIVSLTALPWSGCRFPSREGPAPKSVLECRRLSQQGVAALDRGRQEDAEALLAKAVAACPTDAEAHRNYAESLWRRGARQEATIQLEEASRLAGDDAAIRSRLAEMNLASGQLESAWRNAEKAIELDPRLPGPWAIRGGVMRANGRPDDALTCYLHALGFAPKDRSILLEVAETYRQQNQPERALQTLQSLAQTYSPGDEPAQVEHLLGRTYVALQRYDDAIESLSLAVQRGKPTPEVLFDFGQAQLLAGNLTEAAATARQAATMFPQYQPNRTLLERIQLAQQQQGTILR